MIWISLAFAVLGQGEFSAGMDRYLTCLSAGIPSDLSSQDLQTRTRIYRKAAAQCQRERRAAIESAVREREPGVSEADAQALATDIIDTLDPMSSMSKP